MIEFQELYQLKIATFHNQNKNRTVSHCPLFCYLLKRCCYCIFLTGGGNVMCVCLYQKSVRKVYCTSLQSSATGFLMPDQRDFLSLYSYSLIQMFKLELCVSLFLFPLNICILLETRLKWEMIERIWLKVCLRGSWRRTVKQIKGRSRSIWEVK